MLHFRTLDWGMDGLRKIIVQLDFVNEAGGDVIARSITYAGFVGVLTGVRRDLSISLNFRPNHDTKARFANVRYYSHQLLVLLGLRPSIASILRQYLLPPDNPRSDTRSNGEDLKSGETPPTELSIIERDLPKNPSSAAYLIFSDGDRTITMEKDHRTAATRSAYDFISITNHDISAETARDSQSDPSVLLETGMQALVEESSERQDCVAKLWNSSMRRASRRGAGCQVRKKDMVRWLNTYPITNEETHFATIMDPKAGEVAWMKQYISPAH